MRPAFCASSAPNDSIMKHSTSNDGQNKMFNSFTSPTGRLHDGFIYQFPLPEHLKSGMYSSTSKLKTHLSKPKSRDTSPPGRFGAAENFNLRKSLSPKKEGED